MMIDLTETTTGAIRDTLMQARHQLGGPALGMVLTLVIVTDESGAVRRGARGQPGGPRASLPDTRGDHAQPGGPVPARRRDPGG